MRGNIIDTLREMLVAEPFVAFQITATNGRHYDVKDPQGVAIGKSQLSYYFPKSDRFAHIRVQEIVSLETLQAAETQLGGDVTGLIAGRRFPF